MNYINIFKKRLVGRNNQQIVSPIVIDYSTVEDLSFQLINDQNQIQEITDTNGLYFAGSIGIGKQSYELLFLSKDYEVTSGNIITFKVDTYTVNYLNYIKKKNTEINIEIGQQSLNTKTVILRDYAYACPRVYVSGLSPQEIESNDYYTKDEVDEIIETNLTQADWNEDDPTSASFIKNKPTKLSDFENDEGFITSGEAFDGDYNSLTNKPTKLSDFTNDEGFITGFTEVDPIFTSTSGLFELKSEAFDGDYNSLTNKPTKLSDFNNDEGFITGYIETDPIYTAASGRIVFLNNSGKIDKDLYSTNKQAIYIDSTVYDSGDALPFRLVYVPDYEIFYNTLELHNNFLNIDRMDFPTEDLGRGDAVTFENWIRFYNQDDADTFAFDSHIQVIDEMPDVLSGTQTHVFVRRLYRDENGTYHEQIAYSFSF